MPSFRTNPRLLCRALAILAVVVFPHGSHAELTEGLVASWSFDTGFEATYGDPAFEAIPVGGDSIPVIDSAGRFRGAARFVRADGQYAVVDSPVITQGGDHTYSAWYRATFSSIDNFVDRYFIMESTGVGGQDAYAVSYGVRDIQGDYEDDLGQVFTQWDGEDASGNFPHPTYCQWHNIIVTYDASEAQHAIYLDGSPVLTFASHDPLSDVVGLIIGGDRSGEGHNWDGWIDDVGFWDRVLTTEEITTIQTSSILPFGDIAVGLFVDIPTGLEEVYHSSVAWGDYDGDGDLDILLTGYDSAYAYISRLYRNDGGSFVDIAAGLEGVAHSSVAWGDHDNDGDLDILLTGFGESGYISRVYRNDGGSFVDIAAGLVGVASSSVAWGDYDNDGDLDILLTGDSGSEYISRVYRNDGGSFVDIAAGLVGVTNSSVAWGDYDNDGDLDILLTGYSGSALISRVYLNYGGSFWPIAAGLEGVIYSSVAWGDYDNDGDLDILLTGEAYSSPVALVYRNDGGSFVEIATWLEGVRNSSIAWGDFDNDGDLDILLTGYDSVDTYISRVYRNDGGSFIDITAGLEAVFHSSVAWGDYDRDGDLDILLTGYDSSYTPTSLVYRNDGALAANSPPAAPTNLSAELNGTTLALSWDAATDAETPASGLTYNLRVGITSGGNEICSAHADITTGLRLVPRLGNAQQRTTWELEVPADEVYYWSVQALDGCFTGSAFAVENVCNNTGTGVADQRLPAAFALRCNFPNPFNPETTIGYELPHGESVCLQIFDIVGRRVRTLLDRRTVPAGHHQAMWNGRDDMGRAVAAGVYLYRLEAGSFLETRRMVLIK